MGLSNVLWRFETKIKVKNNLSERVRGKEKLIEGRQMTLVKLLIVQGRPVSDDTRKHS